MKIYMAILYKNTNYHSYLQKSGISIQKYRSLITFHKKLSYHKPYHPISNQGSASSPSPRCSKKHHSRW